MTDLVVKTVEELKKAPEEYREAVAKLVISHAVNELYGAQVFDEPAIAYAPTPYAKWLTCRVAMEEYGHHVRFKQLGTQIGIPEERMVPGSGKKPLHLLPPRRQLSKSGEQLLGPASFPYGVSEGERSSKGVQR